MGKENAERIMDELSILTTYMAMSVENQVTSCKTPE